MKIMTELELCQDQSLKFWSSFWTQDGVIFGKFADICVYLAPSNLRGIRISLSVQFIYLFIYLFIIFPQ